MKQLDERTTEALESIAASLAAIVGRRPAVPELVLDDAELDTEADAIDGARVRAEMVADPFAARSAAELAAAAGVPPALPEVPAAEIAAG